RHVRLTKPRQVRRDQVVAIGKKRNQIAEHMASTWKAMQQQQRWSFSRPGLAIGNLEAIHISGKVMGRCHEMTSDAYDHLPAGLIRFHRLVSITDIVKLEDLGGLRLENAFHRLINDFLHGDVRNRKLRRAKYEASEKCEVDSAGHLQQRVKVLDGVKSSQPAREAHAASATKHAQ